MRARAGDQRRAVTSTDRAMVDEEVLPVVLVTDDDLIMRKAVAALWESDALRIVEASNAAEALQQSALWPRIELAIIDLQLDGADGIAVAERVSADHPEAAIVCISASTPSDGQRRRMARFRFFSKDESLFGHLTALTTDARNPRFQPRDA